METTCGKIFDATQFVTSSDTSWFLGCGGCGEARKCLHDGKPVVVKRLTHKNESESRLQRELKIHSRIQNSPHVVKLYGLVKWLGFTALVLEYVSRGNFLDILTNEKKYKILPWGVRLNILCNIADALIHLHENCGNREFIHGDVKSENVLITEDFSGKLSDFGATNTRKRAETNYDSMGVKRTTQRTSLYTAPELLKDSNQDRTVEIDVYSFGCLIYDTITRIQVFSDADRPGFVVELSIQKGVKPNDERIESVRIKLQTDKERSVFQQLVEIYEQCLNLEPNNRPNLCEIRQQLQRLCDHYGQDIIQQEKISLQQRHPVKNSMIKPNNQAFLCDFKSSFREIDTPVSGFTNPNFQSEDHTLENQPTVNDTVCPKRPSKDKNRGDEAQLLTGRGSVPVKKQNSGSPPIDTRSSIHDPHPSSDNQPEDPFSSTNDTECSIYDLFFNLRRLCCCKCCPRMQDESTVLPKPLP